ncbi:hypothetical protein K431DRAFT_349065 [Polychaeton citri CBS 116435]|uniref:Uncharacterized protein n=1 Tax=Polychaeton citri CBS 116435 TaxID=1314669 RepID=A0A9P4Q2B6_9PEZI|nr:hypothetical protein K431DRAFT_349065 [Polychaeton citri CBS 116435]
MAAHAQRVRSNGIIHGLAAYPPSTHGLTAVITGANGISGHYMLCVPSQSHEHWNRIICLSRRHPSGSSDVDWDHDGQRSRNRSGGKLHIPIDFLGSPGDVAEKLRLHNVGAVHHVFFFPYIQAQPEQGQGLWSDAEIVVRINLALLATVLEALRFADIRPKLEPRTTADIWAWESSAELLYCSNVNQSCSWTVAMPGPILGSVPDAAMNAAFPLPIHAHLCRRLGAALDFPADTIAWRAMMNAYSEGWSALTPAAAGQRFNVTDSSASTWKGIWLERDDVRAAWRHPAEETSAV